MSLAHVMLPKNTGGHAMFLQDEEREWAEAGSVTSCSLGGDARARVKQNSSSATNECLADIARA